MKLANLLKFWVWVVGVVILFNSCSDNEEEFIVPVSEFTPETFADLTIEEVEALETPFEEIFSAINPGGRVSTTQATEEEISEKLEEIFPGAQVLEIEVEKERGLKVWDVEIKMPSGGIIEVVFVVDLGEILEMEGQSGPFDYNIEPGGSFITLEQAFDEAQKSQPGEIERWELELEEDDQWEYEIHISNNDGRWEVEIDAFSGETIKIKQKDAEEDDEEEFEKPGDSAPQTIIDIALAMVPGEVIHSEFKEKDDGGFWNIFVMTPVDAGVKLSLAEDGGFIEAKGEEEPFDYTVEPGGDLISFTEALDILLNETEGELEEWKLRQKEFGDDLIWVYQFELKDGEHEIEVKIDAKSGEVLEIEIDGEDEDDMHEVQAPQDIIDKALSIVSGDVVKTELEEEDGLVVWEIVILTDAGSAVKVELTEDADLVEVKGKEDPFTYEVEPGMGLINFSEAKDIAKEAVDGEIIKWELEIKDQDLWVYEFKLVVGDKEFEVEIDASTGEVLKQEEDQNDEDNGEEDDGEEDDGEEDDNQTAPQDLLQIALDMVAGDVIHSEMDDEFGQIIWEILVLTDAGSVVEVELTEDGALLEIEGEEAPFDYEVDPGEGFITFGQAKDIALEEIDGEILEWELERDDEDRWIYQFKIEVEGEEVEVVIDAETGEIIE